MSEATEQHHIDRLIIDSDPTARFVAAVAYRCAGRLPITDMESLRDALTASGALRLESGELSFEHLPKVPDGMLPIEDVPDLIAKTRAAVAFAHTVSERGLFANQPEIKHLADAVTLATAPVDVPPPVMVGGGRTRRESLQGNERSR